jgi:hypothetical protein
MAKIKPEYQELPEFVEIMQKVLDRYPSVFPDINPDQIAAVQIVNKARPEKKNQVWDLKPVKAPVTLFCPKIYFVVLYSSDWDVFDEARKAAVVADILFSISPTVDGDTIPFDKRDHSIILRTLGVDYMSEPTISNILEENVDWKQ